MRSNQMKRILDIYNERKEEPLFSRWRIAKAVKPDQILPKKLFPLSLELLIPQSMKKCEIQVNSGAVHYRSCVVGHVGAISQSLASIFPA